MRLHQFQVPEMPKKWGKAGLSESLRDSKTERIGPRMKCRGSPVLHRRPHDSAPMQMQSESVFGLYGLRYHSESVSPRIRAGGGPGLQ